MAVQIQIRRDTVTNWTNTNPVLAQGELGYEIDGGEIKIGDGITAWNSLAYFSYGANLGENLGSGEGVYATASGIYLQFKSLVAGDNISLISDDYTITISGATGDHGDLTGREDDDHTQYHTDARGDARYYTETELNNGQLDDRYYTETEVDTISGSITDQLVTDHSSLTGLAADDHTQYSLADGTRAFSATVSGVTPTDNAHLTTKNYVDTAITTATGSLTVDHSALDNLDYASAGHTGFQPAGDYSTITQLTTTSGDIVSQIPTDFYTTDEITTISGNIVDQIPTDYYTVGEVDTISGSLQTNIDGKISNVVEDTSPQLGGDLEYNNYNQVFNTTLTSDDTASGDIITVTFGESVVFGNVCYPDGTANEWMLALGTNAAVKHPAMGVALESKGNGETGKLLLRGIVRDATYFSTFALGDILYLSDTASGGWLNVAPSDSGDIVQIVGWVLAANYAYFNPDYTYVERA